MSNQRNGFVEGCKYVFEERLSGGRLLVHLFGDENNKRIIPVGVWFKNKLYLGDKPDETIYNGTNFRPFTNSILTCVRADAVILEFSGLFSLEDSIDDNLGFRECMFYTFNRVESDGRIVVTVDVTGEELIIPKGAVFQNDTMVDEYRIYDGSNCLPVGRLYCVSTDENLIFQGSFSKFEFSLEENLERAGCNKCPNCRGTLEYAKKGDYSMLHKRGTILPKDYDSSKNIRMCRKCGYINIKIESSVCEVTIFGNPDMRWELENSKDVVDGNEIEIEEETATINEDS